MRGESRGLILVTTMIILRQNNNPHHAQNHTSNSMVNYCICIIIPGRIVTTSIVHARITNAEDLLDCFGGSSIANMMAIHLIRSNATTLHANHLKCAHAVTIPYLFPLRHRRHCRRPPPPSSVQSKPVPPASSAVTIPWTYSPHTAFYLPMEGMPPFPDWLDDHILCFLPLASLVPFSSSSFDSLLLLIPPPGADTVKGGSGLSTEDSPGVATGGDDDDGLMLSGGG